MAVRREWYAEISSTQERALALARAGAPEGTRVVAAVQEAGRGRLDHVWASPPGGLYLSIVLAAPDETPGFLPLAVGARLAEAIAMRFGLALRVKWPNDLLVADGRAAGRKLAGILLDRVPAGPRAAVVAGIGVNVATDPDTLPATVRPEAAVLARLVAEPVRPDDVEPVVVAAALSASEGMRSSRGREALRALARRLLFGVGRAAKVDGRPVGRIRGIDDDGALWVEEEGRRMAIRAGDLRVEEGS